MNRSHTTTKTTGVVSLVLFIFVGFQFYQGQKTEAITLASIQTNPRQESEILACERDKDCIAVTAGCCSCEHNGGRIAINRKYYSYWLEKNNDACIFYSCDQFKSEDFSCLRSLKPKCHNNKCLLK